MNAQVLQSLRQISDSANPSIGQDVDSIVCEIEPTDSNNALLAPDDPIDRGPLALIELILKDPDRLDRLIRRPDQQAELLPRFLAISLIGFTFFGMAMVLVLSATAAWPHLFAIDSFLAGHQSRLLQFDGTPAVTMVSPWFNGDALRLIGAYTIGLIGATGICLPSLYYYGLLSGIRMTMMDVVIHAIKSKAVAAVTLIGVLPIYAAFGLAVAIFPIPEPPRNFVLIIGLILPFIAGLSGTYSLYRGLSTLTDTMAGNRRAHRECFLQRLVLSWAAVYSAVSPVLIFTLWQRFQG